MSDLGRYDPKRINKVHAELNGRIAELKDENHTQAIGIEMLDEVITKLEADVLEKTDFMVKQNTELLKLRAEVKRLKATAQQFAAVWDKFCELESMEGSIPSGITEIAASFLYGAGFSEGINTPKPGE